MGYACPVCGTEAVDARHLANHLAVTASLDRQEHVEWLAEHAPDWYEQGPEQLADAIVPHVPEVDVAFDDGDGTAPSVDTGISTDPRSGRHPTAGDAVTADVLRVARELTDEMARDSAGEVAGDTDEEGLPTDVDTETGSETETQ